MVQARHLKTWKVGRYVDAETGPRGNAWRKVDDECLGLENKYSQRTILAIPTETAVGDSPTAMCCHHWWE